jgi:pimeloyl-ACP methyl ester carboxylesterase
MSATPADAFADSRDGTKIAYHSIGAGPGLLVLGGSLRRGLDYMPLAQALSRANRVHVVDRRGRGASGAQGAEYGIEREVEDLLAVQAQTGASAAFGHSFGGLVALEAARRSAVFSDVIVYEPGVSIGGSIPSRWTARYRQLLAAGDARGAFATMVRCAGFAPAALRRMPLWAVKLVLGLAIRDASWAAIVPHLATSVAEHEQLAAVDDGGVERFEAITAQVLLLGGANSPRFITSDAFDRLRAAIARCDSEVIDGLGHTAPDEKAPALIAQRIEAQLQRRPAPAG